VASLTAIASASSIAQAYPLRLRGGAAEQQAQQATIESQVAALKEKVVSDGHVLLPQDIYLDDGYSGGTLVRPALERLPDGVAEGAVDRLYVRNPDRLARKYAYPVLLLGELRKHGVTVVFLNGPSGKTAEDQLLVQVQGMIAEDKRAVRVGSRTARSQQTPLPAQRARRTLPPAGADGVRPLRLRVHYCVGHLAHRHFGGQRTCPNPSVRVEQLDDYVWKSVSALLQDPTRLFEQWRQRQHNSVAGELQEQRDEAAGLVPATSE
jgi:hypothetical protein